MPATYDLTFYRGTQFAVELHFTNGGETFDMSGWSFASQIRYAHNAAPVNIHIDHSHANEGKLVLSLTDEETETIQPGRWDLIGAEGSDPYTGTVAFVAGKVSVTEGVTHD